MSFKYINPGYSKFVVRKEPSDLYDYVDATKSRTGISFGNRHGNYGNYIDISNFTGDELWAKCDFFWNRDCYSSASSYTFYFGECGSTYHMSICNGVYINFPRSGNGTHSVRVYLSSSSDLLATATRPDVQSILGLKPNAINTVWLHIKYGDAGVGFVEIKINNKKFAPQNQRKVERSSSSYFYFQIDSEVLNGAGYFSSVIISDEYIDPKERVIALPVSNTVTDFDALPSGLYRADTSSETLLQSVSVNSLVEQYGSDTNVTGIALIGNPAYQVDDIIGSLTALTTENNIVTEHGKFTLLTDTDAMICSSFSTASTTTIADLANMQFGWRAEE